MCSIYDSLKSPPFPTGLHHEQLLSHTVAECLYAAFVLPITNIYSLLGSAVLFSLNNKGEFTKERLFIPVP